MTDQPQGGGIPVGGVITDEIAALVTSYSGAEPEKIERKSFGFPATAEEQSAFAKAVVAMANSQGGFVLLGVTDDGESAGIDFANADNAVLGDSVAKYVRPAIADIQSRTFSNDSGKQFLIVMVGPVRDAIHVTVKDGPSIKKDTIYVRRSGQSLPATYDDISRMIGAVCARRHREFAAQLENTQIQRDLRLLVNGLLGDEEQVMRADSIADLEGDDFAAEIRRLAIFESKAQIRALARLLRNRILSKWRSIKGLSDDDIRGIRDQWLLPDLNRLTLLVMFSVKESPDTDVFEHWLACVVEVYLLSNNRQLGSTSPGEQIQLAGGRAFKAKDHLTFSVPAKEVQKRILILAALLRFLECWDLLVLLSRKCVRFWSPEGGTRECQLVAHPLIDFGSGEGTYVSIFDEAHELLFQTPDFRTLFDIGRGQSAHSAGSSGSVSGFRVLCPERL